LPPSGGARKSCTTSLGAYDPAGACIVRLHIAASKQAHWCAAGGAVWLLALRGQPYDDVIAQLTQLSGVGPKVAACIALFSCDQHAAIPVDTHVWKLASKYYLPSVKAKTLTPKLHPVIMQARLDMFKMSRQPMCWRPDCSTADQCVVGRARPCSHSFARPGVRTVAEAWRLALVCRRSLTSSAATPAGRTTRSSYLSWRLRSTTLLALMARQKL
jgi:hypothetical protein